ncbi:M48 family metalloprotease [Trichothermofontia sp.]
MTAPIDPSPNSPNPSVQADLTQGLQAINHGDYDRAISHLEAVCQALPANPILVKAQMGLVLTYAKTGREADALILCQSLLSDPDPTVRQWADRNLTSLYLEFPALSTFAAESPPLQEEAPPSTVERPSTMPEITGDTVGDTTGLVPQGDAVPAQRKRQPKPLARPTPAAGLPPADASPADHSSRLSSPVRSRSVTPGESIAASGAPALTLTELPDSPPAIAWLNHGRATTWQPLPALSPLPLWLGQMLAAIAVLWLIRLQWQGSLLLLRHVFNFLNTWSYRLNSWLGLVNNPPWLQLPNFGALGWTHFDPIWLILGTGGLLFLLSPWWLDRLLRGLYGLQPFNLSALQTHSPEAVHLLQRVGRQMGCAPPRLGLLPTPTPLLLTYGCLPRFSRIVVSQGVLDQLTDEEIATLYAVELGHWRSRSLCITAGLILILQLPFSLYVLLARWSDALVASRSGRFWPLRRWGAAIGTLLSALSYGCFRLVRQPLLMPARSRFRHSDRFAASLTGNPNALIRALLKTAQGINRATYRSDIQGSYLLEGFEPIVPVAARQAWLLAGCRDVAAITTVLTWDCVDPARAWLPINQAQPLLGVRLQPLIRYARRWSLLPELDLPQPKPQPLTQAAFQTLLGQATPWIGGAIGLFFGGFFWSIGGVGEVFRFAPLDWMAGDRALLWGFGLVGVGAGIFLRSQTQFPDYRANTLPTTGHLSRLWQNWQTAPMDSHPARLQGILIGRSGAGNSLGQEILLYTPDGVVKLHLTAAIGVIGNLRTARRRLLASGYRQAVTVQGWLHRRASVWMDVDCLRLPQGKTLQSYPTIAATLWVLLLLLWGTITIARGQG